MRQVFTGKIFHEFSIKLNLFHQTGICHILFACFIDFALILYNLFISCYLTQDIDTSTEFRMIILKLSWRKNKIFKNEAW